LKKSNILVTGGSGFVGSILCAELIARQYHVRATLRSSTKSKILGCEYLNIGDISSDTDWSHALNGIDIVFHLAARAHLSNETSVASSKEFQLVNLMATENLAKCAAASGVKRFIYLSSIGVNGLQTDVDQVFSETDEPKPHNAYTISKWEAEQSLLRFSKNSGLEVVIVRSPLVYGANAPGNFFRMMKVISFGIPLPLASVNNLRSLIYVENLVDALILCATHSKAAGQLYLISDGEDISTHDLLRHLAKGSGRQLLLFSFPPRWLKFLGCLTGKSEQIDRLLGSLQIDSGKICRELDWQPPYTLREGLRRTSKHYRGMK
jgi:nucleoside-diphosphate-sugar epimerase